MSHLQNITRIKAVYNALEELASKVVFVGGAVVSLYADRPATDLRPTDDIDILVELLQYSDYVEIEEKLRSKGFENDVESGVLCRYRINGIIVDVMPTNKNILGFSNRWYPEGYKNAREVRLDDNYHIRIFHPAWFIASKLDAFRDRGKNDGRMSTDFEDIVFVLNNRINIWEEMNSSPPLLKEYLQQQFGELLANEHVFEWISCHLNYTEHRRATLIIGGLQNLIQED